MSNNSEYIGHIYKYKSPSGKIYIGQTKTTLSYRAGKNGQKYRSNGNGLFWKAINKYGFSSFKSTILFTAKSYNQNDLIKVLNEKEKYYIKKYRSNISGIGYNLTDGGDSYVMSDYARKRISDRMKGSKLSEAHRKSISIEMYRRWREGIFSEERNKKVSQSNKHCKTKQHALNISVGRKKSMLDNPEKFAYLKSPDFKGHRFKPGHPRTRGSLGMKWYNDGVNNYLCKPEKAKSNYIQGIIRKNKRPI